MSVRHRDRNVSWLMENSEEYQFQNMDRKKNHKLYVTTHISLHNKDTIKEIYINKINEDVLLTAFLTKPINI